MSMTSNVVTSATTAAMGWQWSSTTGATGYQIVFAEYINGTWQTPVTNCASAPAYSFANIPWGTPCEVLVAATNNAGIGPTCTPCWPIAAGVQQVTGMLMTSNAVVNITNSCMTWRWNAAMNATGYQVVLSEYLNGSWQLPITNYTSAAGYTFAGIMPGTPCEIVVSGTNSLLTGQSCLPCWPFAADYVSQIKLDWGNGNSNGLVAGYNIYSTNSAGNVKRAVIYGANTLGATVSISNMQYETLHFVATCFDTNGNESGFSNEAQWKIGVGAWVDEMLMTTNVALTPTSSTMAWQWPPACAATHSPYPGYQVVFNEYLNGAWQTPVTNYTSGTNYTFSGIQPGTPCEVLVSGVSGAFVGPMSYACWPVAASYVNGIAQVTGMSMLSDVANGVNNAAMVWQWSPALNAVGYEVLLREYVANAWQVPATNYTQSTTFNFTNLPTGIPCEVLVAGTNSSNVGPFCQPCWPYTAVYAATKSLTSTKATKALSSALTVNNSAQSLGSVGVSTPSANILSYQRSSNTNSLVADINIPSTGASTNLSIQSTSMLGSTNWTDIPFSGILGEALYSLLFTDTNPPNQFLRIRIPQN